MACGWFSQAPVLTLGANLWLQIACMISSTLGTAVAVTGHSLGRNKLASILAGGKMTRSETEAQYRIGRRIEAEERALDYADVIFTSTVQEVRAYARCRVDRRPDGCVASVRTDRVSVG